MKLFSASRTLPLLVAVFSVAVCQAQSIPPGVGVQPANFAPPVIAGTLLGAVQPSDVVTGDWNGDGIEDIATTNGPGNSVSVILGVSAAPLAWNPLILTVPLGAATGSLNPISITAGDYDLDGDQDLAVLMGGTIVGPTRSTMVLLSNPGTGAFVPGLPFANAPPRLAGGSQSMASADLNGDGIPDLVGITTTGVSLVISAAGTVVPPTPVTVVPTLTTTGVPEAVAIADIDLDGILDIVVTANQGVAPIVATVELFRGLGGGAFTAIPLTTTLASATMCGNFALIDASGDGILEPVVCNGAGIELTTTALPAAPGVSPFVAVAINLTVFGPGANVSIQAIDVDGDGLDDLAHGEAGGIIGTPNGSFGIQRNTGPFAFVYQGSQGVPAAATGGPALAEPVDLDADGLLDIVSVPVQGQVLATTNRTPSAAWSESYGAPCTITGGLNPTLNITPPAFGQMFTISINAAQPNASAFIVTTDPRIGNIPGNPFPNVNCDLWIDDFLLSIGAGITINRVTDAAGNFTENFAGPAFVPSTIGRQFMTQAFIVVPGVGGTFSGSDATNGFLTTIGF